MADEQRQDKRVNISLPVKWFGMGGRHEGRLEVLSLGGCFVNTTGQVEMDEVVSLEIRLPSGNWLGLRGEVKSYQPEIGFGLLFSFLTGDEEEVLRELINE